MYQSFAGRKRSQPNQRFPILSFTKQSQFNEIKSPSPPPTILPYLTFNINNAKKNDTPFPPLPPLPPLYHEIHNPNRPPPPPGLELLERPPMQHLLLPNPLDRLVDILQPFPPQHLQIRHRRRLLAVGFPRSVDEPAGPRPRAVPGGHEGPRLVPPLPLLTPGHLHLRRSNDVRGSPRLLRSLRYRRQGVRRMGR